MKKFSKILSVALLVALVLSLGVSSAFAVDQQHTITITNNDQFVSHTYEAYQVFKGDLSADGATLSNIVWGNGVNGADILSELTANNAPADLSVFSACTDAASVAKALGDNSTAALADAFAKVVAKHLVAANKYAFTASEKTYTATVPSDGYYFVQDVTTNLVDSNGNSDTVSKYILQVVKDVSVEAKDTGIPADKNIVEADGSKVKEGSKNIGDVIDFEVTSKVPDTSAYTTYTFNMYDTLDAGLTYFDTLAVKFGDTLLTAGTDYTVTVKTGETAFEAPTTAAAAVTTAGGQTITINFTNIKTYGDVADYQGKDIVITYKAVLNKNATMGVVPNENEVYFEYSNNPNDLTSKGNTPHIITKTYTTALDVLKVNGSSQALEGAIFELTGMASDFMVVSGEKFVEAGYTAQAGETLGTTSYWKLVDGSYTSRDPQTTGTDTKQYADTTKTYFKVTMNNVVMSTGTDTKSIQVVSGADGKMVFTGLKPGTYTLTEIAAPDGYNKITTPINVVITWDKDNGFKLGDASSEGWTENKDSANASLGTFHLEVENNSGATLPCTGGIGTTIFYVVGGVLVLAAIILLVTKKRMSE